MNRKTESHTSRHCVGYIVSGSLSHSTPFRRVRLISPFLVDACVSLTFFILLASGQSGRAGSATWNLNPTSNDWNTAANWTPPTVPNGPDDVATFDVSNVPNISVATVVEIGAIVFNPGASAYTIIVSPNASINISGDGIANNSGIEQIFAPTNSVGVEPGTVIFSNNATAGNLTKFFSTLRLGEGLNVFFEDSSSGGGAEISLRSSGYLDISLHDSPGVKVGSIESDGPVNLGNNNLMVGANNRSMFFQGIIQGAGSLTKIGTGTLTLFAASTYAGRTTINAGALLVKSNGSSTGTGPVKVNAGTFGGRSPIAGAVTVGTGSGSGAFLAPGVNATGTLLIKKTLTLKADSTYNCELNTVTAKAGQVAAKGVMIESGARFAFLGKGSQVLPSGTVFTIINSVNPISGSFANLADGSSFTANGNTFQVSYEGGDGNDLTLTVVP